MIALTQIPQETDYYCGPAVIQMLLNYFGKEITQNEFVNSAEIANWIKAHGTQPGHMSVGISRLAPDFKILFKNKATVQDLEYLIHVKHWPVAINWQGLFYDTPEEETGYPSPDNGHYSIVVDINVVNDTITLVDPYPYFANELRHFSLSWFTERWWDIADALDSQTQENKKILTNQLLFIVVPKSETVPDTLNMTSSVTLS